jgi:hypothetical protein
MTLAAFGDSKIMNGQVTLWQVVAAVLGQSRIQSSSVAHYNLVMDAVLMAPSLTIFKDNSSLPR